MIMKTTIKLGILSLAASAVLVGCGSSGTSTTDTNTDTNLETGYFIDAAVEGLTYRTTSGQEGVTDAYGRFKYQDGDKVAFKIGKLDLGEATPDQEGLVTPQTIAGEDADLKVQLLRVLQALDSDNNPSNGITIPSEVVTAFAALPQDVKMHEVQDDQKLLDLNQTIAARLDKDYDGKIDIDQQRAENHFAQSIQMWQSGHRPDSNETMQGNHGEGHGYGQGKRHGPGQGKVDGTPMRFDPNDYPMSTLTQELKDALAYMGNEERLAYDIYMNLYAYYLENGDAIRQFKNIAERSESRHIAIVQDLVKRYNLGASDLTNVENPTADNTVAQAEMPAGQYDVPAIQELYDTLYAKGIQSRQDALEVGCMVEVTDVDDLDKYITYAEDANATDVLEGFKILRDGSYKHYWAFDKGLKNMGVAEGCAVLGDAYAKTQEEYPSSH